MIRSESALITDIYLFTKLNLKLSKSTLILIDLMKGILISLGSITHFTLGKTYFEFVGASETLFQAAA